MIELLLGVIIGLLLNPGKKKIIKVVKHLHENIPGKSQFLEPFPFKEKFSNAKKITDVLK